MNSKRKNQRKRPKKAEKKGKKKAHFLGLSSSFVKVFVNKKFGSMSEQWNGWQILELRRFKLKKDSQNYYCKTRRA